jgi:2-oxoglutarate dehydrogenase E2 component (dihydrolipoamide succinyltransferase)
LSSDIEVRMPADEKEGTEASVGKWLKKVGAAVSENEPLVEIATDKVTVEIAAPGSGVLGEIVKREGDAVQPGDLLGTIRAAEAAEPKPGQFKSNVILTLSETKGKDLLSQPAPGRNAEDGLSPAVRRLLKEHNLDAAQVPATGNRLTIADVEKYLSKPAPQSSDAKSRKVPHTPMRKAIAANMLRAVQSAPLVTAVFEANLAKVLTDREQRKQQGEAPSVTAYLIHAAVAAMRAVPEVNSRWHDDALEIFDEVNLGFGTALENGGLVVPVIRNAEKLSLEEISTHLRELTAKARAGKLTRSDMDGGTFTISNHGVSGSLLATPILPAPGQAAILGAGKLQKRVTVGESGSGKDLFRVQPMMYVTLTVDHRALDAQQTNAWLTAFVAALES